MSGSTGAVHGYPSVDGDVGAPEPGSGVGTAWPLQTHLPLGALPSAASCARGHVRSVAMEWGLADLADTAELVTSELITNAIQASERLRIRTDLATVHVVELWLISDQISLVIHVWDSSNEMPVRRNCGPDDETGRGLMLVQNLSSEWGVYRGRRESKEKGCERL